MAGWFNKILELEVNLREEDFPDDCFGEFFSQVSPECRRCPDRRACQVELAQRLARIEEERKEQEMARAKHKYRSSKKTRDEIEEVDDDEEEDTEEDEDDEDVDDEDEDDEDEDDEDEDDEDDDDEDDEDEDDEDEDDEDEDDEDEDDEDEDDEDDDDEDVDDEDEDDEDEDEDDEDEDDDDEDEDDDDEDEDDDDEDEDDEDDEDEDDVDEEEEDEAPPPQKVKKVKREKPAKRPKKAATVKRERDEWGWSVGTRVHWVFHRFLDNPTTVSRALKEYLEEFGGTPRSGKSLIHFYLKKFAMSPDQHAMGRGVELTQKKTKRGEIKYCITGTPRRSRAQEEGRKPRRSRNAKPEKKGKKVGKKVGKKEKLAETKKKSKKKRK